MEGVHSSNEKSESRGEVVYANGSANDETDDDGMNLVTPRDPVGPIDLDDSMDSVGSVDSADSIDDMKTEVDPVDYDKKDDKQTNQPNNAAAHRSGGDDDDVASKAAVALAAVAAAATANNKSPAEAAREARAVAQSFISQASDPSEDNKQDRPKRAMEYIKLSVVKTHLRRRALETGSLVADKLGQGENDAFLQLLLLIEFYRCVDDSASQEEGSEANESDPVESARAELACEKLEGVLKRIEGAYDSMVDLLPHGTGTNKNINEFDDVEKPIIVPDLLPPCTSPNGDATVAFFRACLGDGTTASTGASDQGTKSEVDSTDAGTAENNRHDTVDQSISTKSGTTPTKQSQGMFSSMFRRAGSNTASSTRGSMFRKKGWSASKGEDVSTRSLDTASTEASAPPVARANGEYLVTIEREMLGLTVENVLERTVVRTVAAGGPARKAGAKVGSLIVKVGNVETKNLTHFETIDELRQSNRPLQLVLRQISDESLRAAREEMGRLIRGSGFGKIMEGNSAAGESLGVHDASNQVVRPLIGADLRIDAYTNMVRRRYAEASIPPKNRKDEAVSRIGEKLIWMLTLFVVGLEREAVDMMSLASSDPGARRNSYSIYHRTAKDYADAAKSVAKVLFDYVRKKIDPTAGSIVANNTQNGAEYTSARKGKKGPPPAPGRAGRGYKRQHNIPGSSTEEDTSLGHEKPLPQIGDVLQRTRTFLADTTSPPAALLRGELISFLCDVLDVDSEMELSEEEAVSAAISGSKGGGINDLGSAGSLLKLMVLNCPTTRSPGCEEISSRDGLDAEVEAEMRRRFGPRENFSADDLHRLHAGNRFLAVVHRLAASRSTSARITACSLGPVIWGHLDFPHQLQLRGVITRALHDVEVIVRKATATVLHEIAELVFDPRCVPWLVLMSERAMTDPEPQLRSSAMTLTWHLADHLPNAFLGDASQGSRYLRRLPERDDPIFADVYLLQCKLLPVATRLAEDRSPSVRLAVAAQCDRLCDALGQHWSSVVIDVLLALLSDSDERVRCEGVSCVPRLSEIVLLSPSPGETAISEASILEALLPAAIKLKKDPSSSVRVALAESAGEILKILVAMQNRSSESGTSSQDSGDHGKQYKKQVDERLIPLVQNLLNDNDPEVTSAALRAVTNATRSSVQQRVRKMSIADDDSASVSSAMSLTSRDNKPVFLPVLSEVQVLRLLPTLTELADSKQWRVRQSAVEIVPALLGCTHKLETRSEISKLCVRLMADIVDAVRKTAAECLCMGGSSLGSHGEEASAEWVASIVIPTIRRCAISNDSKQRLLSLKMVEVVLTSGSCPAKWKGNEEDSERMTDSPMRELAAIALSLSTDRIANVRLNVGRVLESVISTFEEEEVSFIREVLTQQIDLEQQRYGGGDRDVLYFARKCVGRAKLILDDGSTTLSI